MKSLAVTNYDLEFTAAKAAEDEALGVDYISAVELAHDPMLQLAMAATSTSKAQLISAITVAFARSPMTLALQAHEVNCLSKGRLTVGLGSQIKPHIERRYSMPWSKPAARMREYVLALRAIWANWYDGTPMNFEGEFYTHTLMTPMFVPDNKQYGAPSICMAAVGPLMTEYAAEVADGILLHSFVTEEYIRSVMLPAIETGLQKSGRCRKDIRLIGSSFFVTGETQEEYDAVKKAVCAQIAFYASTPAYKAVLDSIGYGDLQPELLRLSKKGEWAEMGNRIDDTLLEKMALVGQPAQIAEKLKQRYGDIFDVCSANVLGREEHDGPRYSAVIGDIIKAV